MKMVLRGSFLALTTLSYAAIGQTSVLLAPPGQTVPRSLFGRWSVGTPYKTGQVTGLGVSEEAALRKLVTSYTATFVQSCGKRISFRNAVKSIKLTAVEFQSNFDLSFAAIGMHGPRVTELYIEHLPSDTACGLANFPGTHVFMDDRGHAVLEVEGDYLPLIKIIATAGRP